MKNRICSLLLIIILFVVSCFIFMGATGEAQQDLAGSVAP